MTELPPGDPGDPGDHTGGPSAADDPGTAAHERRKSLTFLTLGVIGVVLLVVGIFLATRGSWGVLAGTVLFLIGGAAAFAAAFGLYYRQRARRTLMRYPWRRVPVTITGRPAGARGRLVVRTQDESDRAVVITGATADLAHQVGLDAAIEYAGRLDATGMLFVRPVDGTDVYVATLRAT